MPKFDLPLRVFLAFTALLSLVVLAVVVVMGLLARQSVLEQSVSDVGLISDVIERAIQRDGEIPDQVEFIIGQNMANTANAVAEWVAMAESNQSNSAELRERLKELVTRSDVDEVWVTDESGFAYLTTVDGVDFRFSPDATEQPQASEFYPLLQGRESPVIQQTQQREIDDNWFKYVGVTGVDRPRIVQVGRDASDINQLREAVGVADLISALVAQESIEALFLVDSELMPLRGDNRAGAGLSGFTAIERELLARMFDIGSPVTDIRPNSINVAAPLLMNGKTVSGGFFVALSRSGLDALFARIVRVSLLLFTGGVMLALGTGYLVSRRVAEPIWQLTKAASAVQRGDYRQAAKLHSNAKTNSELDRLASAFRDMAGRVEAREQILDGLVKSRTQELESKNALLEVSQERINEQLDFANSLQQAALPVQFPLENAYLSGGARMIPALQVGGDFYDCFPLSNDRLGIVMADVSGKGVAAAFFATMARNAVREAAATELSPAKCLARANRELCARNPILLFVTLNYAVFDLRRRTIVLASAGHLEPFLRREGEPVAALRCAQGVALGILPDVEFQESSYQLVKGDTLFFFTDGINEAINARDEQFGEVRLIAALKRSEGLSARATLDNVFNSIDDFVGSSAQFDDMTAAVLQVS
jgi:sigma-B regulation protein RsbU (phosphoserine phosphatase)